MMILVKLAEVAVFYLKKKLYYGATVVASCENM